MKNDDLRPPRQVKHLSVDVAHNSGVLKQRRIDIDWSLVLKPGIGEYAAFLQNAGGLPGKVPKALPWAGVRSGQTDLSNLIPGC